MSCQGAANPRHPAVGLMLGELQASCMVQAAPKTKQGKHTWLILRMHVPLLLLISAPIR
jgi:hypothetical protein